MTLDKIFVDEKNRLHLKWFRVDRFCCKTNKISRSANRPLIAIDKMTCKTIHRLLVENRDSNPPTAEKKLMEMGFSKEECKKIYSIRFIATKEIKLSMFQYKIIHNILYTNAVLQKMKKVEDPFCPHCPNVGQTVTHLFVFCPIAVSFWSDFTGWY